MRIDQMRNAVVATVLTALIAGGAVADAPIIFVLDASGSMWGQVDGVAKIETARDVLAGLIADLPEGTPIGLVSYGDHREGDCRDVTIVASPGEVAADEIVHRMKSIRPKGKTPIAYSLERAASLLTEPGGRLILISDGVETCQVDPCAVAETLAKGGVSLQIHVVGFDVSREAQNQLECIANSGGGRYFAAGDTKGFEEAIAGVGREVSRQPAEKGLEAWWRFDECDARDELGRYDGVVHGDPECVDGAIGKALRFDGADDYVQIESAVIGDLGEYATLSFWFRPESYAGRILEKDRQQFWVVAYDGGRLVMYLRGSEGYGGADAILEIMPAGFIEKGPRWIPISIRKSGERYDIFVDGKKVRSEGTTVARVRTEAPINFGRSEYWQGQYSMGGLDEVRVYSRALDDLEIESLHSSGPN